MKRSGRIKWGNMWVGIIITFAMAMLLYTSFHGGGTSIFETKDKLVCYFANVNGLVKGAPVWLGGVEVGNVKSVRFVNLDENRRIEAVISIKKSVWEFITTDSKVKLGTIGFLGDKYVEVIPGTKGLPLLESGSVVAVLSGGGLDAVVDKAPGIAGSVDSLMTSLKEIGQKLAGGEGTAGKLINDDALYDNLVATLNQTTELMAEIQKNQKKIMAELSTTLENSSRITGRIDSGQGSLGKLIGDDALYDNLANSSARMDSILAKIDRGEGSVGALINDAEVYEEVRNLLVRVNNLIADIEANPRKYFKFSVF